MSYKENLIFKRNVSIKAKLLLILMALFILSIRTSSQIDNCCFVDRRCNTDEQWTSGYWAFRNGQCAAPSQQQSASPIDNCCFVDRQCNTNEQWVNGYWAFRNGQCAAPSQRQRSTATQSQRQTETSADIDNCCFIGWQCDADEEWKSGYFAFQHDQCASQSQWQEQWRQLQQRQNDNQKQEEEQRQRPDTASDLDDISNDDIQEPKLDDRIALITQYIAPEQLCAIWSLIAWCEERYGR